jgi:hypothetical protein
LWPIHADTQSRIGTLLTTGTPAGKPERLDDEALIALLRKEEEAASGFQDAALSAIREEALAYYDRQPYGDEQEGASSVVTSEFADVVESLMPGLMRVFTGSDDLAKFAPTAPGQEKWAKEASEYVPHVLMRQNDGFRVISALLKDALMYRLSGVTVDLEDVEDKRSVPVHNLTQDAIDLIVSEAEAQGAELVMELAGDPSEPPQPAIDGIGPDMPAPPSQTFSGTITVTHKRKRVVVDSIAPEDIRFSPAARDEDKASFLGFIKRVTSSDLVKLGLTQEEIDDLNADRDLSDEAAQRNEGVLDDTERAGEGDSERPLWLVVAYIRADDDGDGISELLRVVYAHGGGTAGRIVERVEWSGPASIALATPILMSHTIVGRSLFDQTQDLQQLGSVLTRGLLDNLYIVNRPRPVISDQVNLDSLIDWVPGSPIRLKSGARPGDNHVAWLQVPNVTGAVLSALEHLATVRENRTGVSRYNQGLDAESLNKTLGGLDRIMSAASQRQDLIARTFAETAIKRLYRLIYRAIKRAATGPLAYWPRLGGAFASCDPSQWPDDMELSVDVVGIGNREQAIGHLALVGNLQEKLIALQGGKAEGPFVTAENIANGAQKLTEILGYKAPGVFFQPADKVMGSAAAVAPQTSPPAPSPELLTAQAQIEILREAAAADVQIKREKAQADIAIAEFKARQWADIERFKAGLKAGLQAEVENRGIPS